MRVSADRQRFRNEDLMLHVSQAIDRARYDEGRYEAFLDELCGDREYQKDAIRAAMRYLRGGTYANLRDLANQNFDRRDTLQQRYGTWQAMQRHLQLPDQLAASLDLATATGKSFVLYGLAAIMLAEGAVDSVLVLCPSTTIESGLTKKFRELASNAALRDLLPPDAILKTPNIINANESIITGSLCVENYHAVLEHVGTAIRDSLYGKGERVLVLNDEAHHVANEGGTTPRKWKEFLTDAAYNFRYVIGVSGTCYVGDDYFADVIYRYSLRQAMEERFVKRVEYVAEMPRTGVEDEKWQLVRNRHEEIKQKLRHRNLLPLTIVVTHNINKAKDVTDQLKTFLKETEGISSEIADERVLCIYNNAPDLYRLPYVDSPASKVEWIVSVSMLNEGWDVKRVFQIVPHEERAFNSKLLIAQVLGRGLRVPDNWNSGQQPEVTVFNHDSWAGRIKNLVNEVLEIEKRLSSVILPDSPHHFDLQTLDYTIQTTSVTTPMTGPYTLFDKGYVELASDIAVKEVSGVLVDAVTEKSKSWVSPVKEKTYSVEEIVDDMYARLEEADMDDARPAGDTFRYTKQYPRALLKQVVSKSIELVGMPEVTNRARQKFLQSLGTLSRAATETVRYVTNPDNLLPLSTHYRQASSISAAELRRDKTYFYTEQTPLGLKEEQVEFFNEATEQGEGFRVFGIANYLDFKTPLNAVIADSDPEKRFIRALIEPANLFCYDAWIKSTPIGFYEIDFSWKKGNRTKRGKFSPDFFIKSGDSIMVVEIKEDDEIKEPSAENRAKRKAANEHFAALNERLGQAGNSTRYLFHFLTPADFSTFFEYLRKGSIHAFKSGLDVELVEGGV